MQITDMNGKLILENLQSPMNGILKLETTPVATGVYFIRLNYSSDLGIHNSSRLISVDS